MSRKWGLKMIYLAILFVFNLIIIIILSNVKAPSIPNIIEIEVDKINGMLNNPCNTVEIKKYHSINRDNKKDNYND